jgi:hypothetical protein
MANALGARASPWMKTKHRAGWVSGSRDDSHMPPLAVEAKGGVTRGVLSSVGSRQYGTMVLCFEASEQP